MIFSIDKLAGANDYRVYKNLMEKTDFPKEPMELIDVMGWVQNHSSDEEKVLFSKLFSDWRTYVGMEPIEAKFPKKKRNTETIVFPNRIR